MKRMIVALLLGAAGFPAAAANFDYSHLDLAYIRASNDFTTGNGNGYELEGSWSIAGTGFFLEGGYQHQRFGNTPPFLIGITLTPEIYRFGGGYHFALGGNLDLVTHADYLHGKTTAQVSSALIINLEHGFLFGAGLRDKLTDDLELDASLDHDNAAFRQSGVYPIISVLNYRQDGSENVLSVAARYRVTASLDAGLEYRFSSLQGIREWLLSARWGF